VEKEICQPGGGEAGGKNKTHFLELRCQIDFELCQRVVVVESQYVIYSVSYDTFHFIDKNYFQVRSIVVLITYSAIFLEVDFFSLWK
jgi:hypothetical protein